MARRPTLTLVFAGDDPGRPALVADTAADEALLTRIAESAGLRLGPKDFLRLVAAAGLARVRLVIRTDLAPRVAAGARKEQRS